MVTGWVEFKPRHADRGKAIGRTPDPHMDSDLIYFCSCGPVFCYIWLQQLHCQCKPRSETSTAPSALIYKGFTSFQLGWNYTEVWRDALACFLGMWNLKQSGLHMHQYLLWIAFLLMLQQFPILIFATSAYFKPVLIGVFWRKLSRTRFRIGTEDTDPGSDTLMSM